MRLNSESHLSPSGTEHSASEVTAAESASSTGTDTGPRILLIESNQELLESHRLLLATLGLPVDAARAYGDACRLPTLDAYCIAVVGALPTKSELSPLLSLLRRTPHIQILLLGRSVDGLEDFEYDEIVDASFQPAAFVEVAQRLSVLGRQRRFQSFGYHPQKR